MNKKQLLKEDFFGGARELLQDKDFANRELVSARKYMGNRNTTRKQWENIIKTVGMIYFYAPKEISKIAFATLLEMTMREPYMERLWKNK